MILLSPGFPVVSDPFQNFAYKYPPAYRQAGPLDYLFIRNCFCPSIGGDVELAYRQAGLIVADSKQPRPYDNFKCTIGIIQLHFVVLLIY